MTQNMLDIISIHKKVGHLYIFFNMTCNPEWDEKTEALLPGQMATDKLEICARRFQPIL